MIRFVDTAGNELPTPDRLVGNDGPNIEITVCKAGEFIDPKSHELRFMAMPPIPEMKHVQLDTLGANLDGDQGGVTSAERAAIRRRLVDQKNIDFDVWLKHICHVETSQ
jgi:hypothetical protein